MSQALASPFNRLSRYVAVRAMLMKTNKSYWGDKPAKYSNLTLERLKTNNR